MADPAVLVSVAQAVTDALAKHDFGVQPFEPRRSYAEWDEKLEDMDVLHIDVVPNQSGSSELADQSGVKYLCPIDIGVRKRITKSEQGTCGELDIAAIDGLVLLTEQIHEFLLSKAMRRLPTYDSAAWNETALLNRFNRAHLRENRQFTGLIRSTYEVIKDLL